MVHFRPPSADGTPGAITTKLRDAAASGTDLCPVQNFSQMRSAVLEETRHHWRRCDDHCRGVVGGGLFITMTWCLSLSNLMQERSRCHKTLRLDGQ